MIVGRLEVDPRANILPPMALSPTQKTRSLPTASDLDDMREGVGDRFECVRRPSVYPPPYSARATPFFSWFSANVTIRLKYSKQMGCVQNIPNKGVSWTERRFAICFVRFSLYFYCIEGNGENANLYLAYFEWFRWFWGLTSDFADVFGKKLFF